MELLTAAEMRAIEEEAIGSGRVTGLELMERAGAGVVEAVFQTWPDLGAAPASDPGARAAGSADDAREGAQPDRRTLVLCGPGNNGGDGFVIARLLQECGWRSEVFLFGAPDGLPPDAKANHDRWRAQGQVAPVAELEDRLGLADHQAAPRRLDLFVDALFGTGLKRGLPPELARIAKGLMAQGTRAEGRPKVVAVDIPSGLCADSGRVLGTDPEAVFRADLTVSFHRGKLGHVLAEGPGACGTLAVKDIGL